MKKLITCILVAVLFLLGLTSCVTDQNIDNSSQEETGLSLAEKLAECQEICKDITFTEENFIVLDRWLCFLATDCNMIQVQITDKQLMAYLETDNGGFYSNSQEGTGSNLVAEIGEKVYWYTNDYSDGYAFIDVVLLDGFKIVGYALLKTKLKVIDEDSVEILKSVMFDSQITQKQLTAFKYVSKNNS